MIEQFLLSVERYCFCITIYVLQWLTCLKLDMTNKGRKIVLSWCQCMLTRKAPRSGNYYHVSLVGELKLTSVVEGLATIQREYRLSHCSFRPWAQKENLFPPCKSVVVFENKENRVCDNCLSYCRHTTVCKAGQ